MMNDDWRGTVLAARPTLSMYKLADDYLARNRTPIVAGCESIRYVVRVVALRLPKSPLSNRHYEVAPQSLESLRRLERPYSDILIDAIARYPKEL